MEKHEEAVRPQPVDLLELEVGYELIPLVDGEKGAVVERIRALRRQFLTDKGFLVPQIHIRDNLRLTSKQYVILVKGVEAGKGELKPGRLLAMNATGAAQTEGELQGEATQEPAFGLPALWISFTERERAEIMGYTVVDPETVLITHISELVKRYSPELLTRQDVQRLLDGLSKGPSESRGRADSASPNSRWSTESAAKSAARRSADTRPFNDYRNPRRPCARALRIPMSSPNSCAKHWPARLQHPSAAPRASFR